MSEIHWLNAVSGSFTNASDWSGGVVPGAGDDAILGASGAAFTVTANGYETVNSIQTASNATLDIGFDFTAAAGTGAGTNAGKIVIGNYGVLTVAGMLSNTGVIAMTSDANQRPSYLAIRGNTTLDGGGMINMTDNIPNANNRIIAVTPGVTTLTNTDNTISGTGQIGSFGPGQLIFVNEKNGVIDANSTFPLAVEARSGVDINAGLMEATGYGNLEFGTGTFSNTGTIRNSGVGDVGISDATVDDSLGGVLIPGADLTLADGVVIGGDLALTAGQTILAQGYNNTLATATLTSQGSIVIEKQSGLNLQNAVTNTGVITVGSAGGYAFLRIGGTGVTLNGGGSVSLSGSGGGHIFGYQSGTQTLTNVDNTISGAGTIGPAPDGSEVGLVVVNQTRGVIDASGAAALVLSAGEITNAGLIEATGSGGLAIQAAVFHGPVVTVNGSAGGVVLAASGSHVALQGVDLIGGTLESTGTGEIETLKTFQVPLNELDGTSSAVVNQARVVVQNSTALTIQGAIVNDDRIFLTGAGTATTLTVSAAGATLSGGGAVDLTNSADNIITGATSAATLTNVDNTIDGAGELGAGSLTLINEAKGVIVGPFSTALVINTGANAITNAGLIVAKGAGGVTIQSAVANSGLLEADGGVLTMDGAVSGAGEAIVNAGTLDFASSFDQRVLFRASTGVLELGQSQTYSGTITGFSTSGGTSLDLRDIAFVSSTEATFSGTKSGGVLTVTDGTHTAHINLKGNYLTSTFIASSDGDGGTIVVDPKAKAPVATSHLFIAAMAGLGADGAGGAVHAGEVRSVRQPVLAFSER